MSFYLVRINSTKNEWNCIWIAWPKSTISM